MTGASDAATVLHPDPGAALPPLGVILEQLADGAGGVRLAAIADGTRALPDILRLIGVDGLALDPPGRTVAVNGGGEPLHATGLPPGDWDGGSGLASWTHEQDLRMRMATRPAGDPGTVVNPLPFAVRAVARIVGVAAEDRGAVVDAHGRRAPTQVSGQDLLAVLDLPPGGETRVQPCAALGATTGWAVDERVLDNGIVRAELDPQGCLRRCCIDGRFVELAGTLVEPCHRDGSPLYCDAVRVTVVESGPVRSSLRVARRGHGGTSVIGYQLDAESDHLVVSVHDEDGSPCCTSHRLAPHPGPYRLTWDHGAETVLQAPALDQPPPAWRRGWRGLACAADADQAPLALLALDPAAARVHDHQVLVAGAPHLRYALTAADRQAPLGDLRRALVARCPPVSGCSALGVPALHGMSGLLPIWSRPGDDGGSRVVVTVADETRGRAILATGRCRFAHGDGIREITAGDAIELPRGSLVELSWQPEPSVDQGS